MQSRMRGAFRLRRRCSVLVWFAWRCPSTSPVAHRRRGAVSAPCDLSIVPHDTGGVAALCGLGCVEPSIGSTMQCRGLVSAGQCRSITLVVLWFCFVVFSLFVSLCDMCCQCDCYCFISTPLVPLVLLVHLNPILQRAAKPYRQMNKIQVANPSPPQIGRAHV